MVAKKPQARSVAAKKAGETKAVNHQALVDKITAELVAEAQRAADAGGYCGDEKCSAWFYGLLIIFFCFLMSYS